MQKKSAQETPKKKKKNSGGVNREKRKGERRPGGGEKGSQIGGTGKSKLGSTKRRTRAANSQGPPKKTQKSIKGDK